MSSVIPGNALSATARVADSCKLTPRAAAVLQRASAGLLVQGGRLTRASTTIAGHIIGGIGWARPCGVSANNIPIIGTNQTLTIGSAVSPPWPDFGFAVGWNASGKAGAIYGQLATNAVPMDVDLASIYLGRSQTITNVDGYYHQLVAWPNRPTNAALNEKAIPYA